MHIGKVLLAAACISFAVATPAKADPFKSTCLPKPELMAWLKDHKQAMLDQYVRGKDKKTTVTGEHNGIGYVHKGTGYIVESSGNKTACIIAKTRIDPGQGDKQLIISTVHTFQDMEFTSEEWRQVAKHSNTNHAKIKADMINKGLSEKDADLGLNALEILGKHGGYPDEVSAKFLYEIDSDGKVHAISRSDF